MDNDKIDKFDYCNSKILEVENLDSKNYSDSFNPSNNNYEMVSFEGNKPCNPVNKDWISTIKEKFDHYIGHVKDAPHHIKDNEFILNGYRINFNSCKKVTKSLCMCHNETVNVWTHLIGAMVTLLMIIFTSFLVGPYGSRLNSLQNTHILRDMEQFKNYSSIFYSSNPQLHNSRLVLNAMLDFSNKIYATNRDDLKLKDSKTENINKLDIFLPKTIKLNLFLKNLSDKLKEKTRLDCFSCIEDFVRNIFSIEMQINNNYNKLNFNSNQTLFPQDLLKSLETLKIEISKIIDILKEKSVDIKNNFSKVGYYINDELKYNTQLVKWPIYIQLMCAIICLMSSSSFHLYSAYGAKAGEILSRLDYAGISVLIAGSCYPPYYYIFYCSSLYLNVYLAFISMFAFGVFIGSLTPTFNKPHNRRLRGFLFLFLGISTGVPILHILLVVDKNIGMIENPRILLYCLGGATYISGCLIYIARFPERMYPGRFDLVGSSHQIWHIFVFGGIILHHFASINSYYDRLDQACPAIYNT